MQLATRLSVAVAHYSRCNISITLHALPRTALREIRAGLLTRTDQFTGDPLCAPCALCGQISCVHHVAVGIPLARGGSTRILSPSKMIANSRRDSFLFKPCNIPSRIPRPALALHCKSISGPIYPMEDGQLHETTQIAMPIDASANGY